ncbi:hypothetical protein QHF85_28065, partial [Polyangium sp. 6x1]
GGAEVSSSAGASSGSGMGGMGGAGGAGGAGGGGGGGGGGGAPQCTIALQDDFDDGMTNSAKWSNYAEGAGTSIAESGGNLVATIGAGAVGYAVHYSTEAYDISNCAVFVQVLEVPNPTLQAFASLQIGTELDNAIEIVSYQGTLYFHKILAGSFTDVGFLDYDPQEHAFWRIRQQDGTTFWETSPDAQQWTVQASAPNPLPPGDLYVALVGGIDEAAPNPGRGRFDNLNILP